MTEHDKELIARAERLFDWTLVADLEDEAESDEARETIARRRRYLYHREEWQAGMA